MIKLKEKWNMKRTNYGIFVYVKVNIILCKYEESNMYN